ncbi:MAG: branched-chain amino acid ABC transporter permease, partial [Ferrovibrio sp.]
FGIMDLVNLAHGSLYMMGAYFAAVFTQWTGNFFIGALLALPAGAALGIVVEVIALRTLYTRDHLDQVLATFGLILFFNELARIVFGAGGMAIELPDWLEGQVMVLPGLPYPSFRFLIILVGLACAGFLYLLVQRTRLGMLIRAGASNREMVGALGIDIKLLFTLVFGLGSALAALAGLMSGPITTVQIGMGDSILILALVVIVIGGIGSIRGAFIAAVAIGVIDTMGRAFLPNMLGSFLTPSDAGTLAQALSSMLIYILMAGVLVLRPAGLFPAPGR